MITCTLSAITRVAIMPRISQSHCGPPAPEWGGSRWGACGTVQPLTSAWPHDVSVFWLGASGLPAPDVSAVHPLRPWDGPLCGRMTQAVPTASFRRGARFCRRAKQRHPRWVPTTSGLPSHTGQCLATVRTERMPPIRRLWSGKFEVATQDIYRCWRIRLNGSSRPM